MSNVVWCKECGARVATLETPVGWFCDQCLDEMRESAGRGIFWTVFLMLIFIGFAVTVWKIFK